MVARNMDIGKRSRTIDAARFCALGGGWRTWSGNRSSREVTTSIGNRIMFPGGSGCRYLEWSCSSLHLEKRLMTPHVFQKISSALRRLGQLIVHLSRPLVEVRTHKGNGKLTHAQRMRSESRGDQHIEQASQFNHELRNTAGCRTRHSAVAVFFPLANQTVSNATHRRFIGAVNGAKTTHDVVVLQIRLSSKQRKSCEREVLHDRLNVETGKLAIRNSPSVAPRIGQQEAHSFDLPSICHG
mmetsp:Transcript_14699/g.37407  ORF Transcript_14699/g.37407 Transcript_14699/m.37407 type:complete len:241 (-) Transcript_14699:1289-2011(-)